MNFENSKEKRKEELNIPKFLIEDSIEGKVTFMYEIEADNKEDAKEKFMDDSTLIVDKGTGFEPDINGNSTVEITEVEKDDNEKEEVNHCPECNGEIIKIIDTEKPYYKCVECAYEFCVKHIF